ncbi:MAG: SPASM domain-containing protein, partial [Pseudanabaena sp.]
EITISLSVDGLEETHDRIRHQKGSWQQIWKTLEAIKALGGISVKINSVLNAENAHETIDLMKVVRKYEPDFHSIILLRGDPMNPSLGLPTMEELHRLAPAIFEILETYNYGRNKVAARILRNYHRYLWKTSLQTIEQQTQVIPCLAGLAHQVVWGDGKVAPCEMLDPVGSLQTQTLKEITSSPAWQQQLEDIKAKKCHCTHNCAMFDSIFFNPANFLHLAVGSTV